MKNSGFFFTITVALILTGAGPGCAAKRRFDVLHAPQMIGEISADARPFTLVRGGKGAAAIVIPDEKGADVSRLKDGRKNLGIYELAAEELQYYVERSTGARLPIVRAADFGDGPAVFIGMSDAARKAGFTQPELDPEAFQVITRNNCLAILGTDKKVGMLGGPDGTVVEEPLIQIMGQLFGVYDFIERYLGVRFYWQREDGTVVPGESDVMVPPVNYTDWPVMTDREMWRLHGIADGGPDPWLFYRKWRAGYGTGIKINHTHHGGWGKEYGDTHPEYFALKKDGTRAIKTVHGSDLCYSNPDVMRQDIENLKRFYETRGEWRGPWGDWVMLPRASHIPFLPSDCFGGCECAGCKKIVNRRRIEIPGLEGQTELIHHYNAAIAGEIGKLWPEKWVVAGAYSEYTLPPETVTFPDNVIAVVCIMDGLAYHKEPTTREYWFEVIDKWTKLTGGRPIHIWHYGCWPQEGTMAPVHIPRLTVEWHRAAKGRVAGEMVCGILDDNFALGHLSAYFWARAMWNPDFDVDAALDEYYRLMYGPAEPAMKQYFNLMIDRWEKTIWGVKAGRIGGLPVDKLYRETYPEEIRAELQALEQKATEQAGIDTLWRKRVDYVVAAHRDFYREGETFDRLGRGSTLYVERGTPGAIDGKLDDDCWKAPGGKFLTRNTGDTVPYRSRVKAVYDDLAFYIAARFDEPEMNKIVATARHRDDPSWAEDSIEIFLSPRDYPEHYVQIAVNTNGAVFDGWKPAIAGFSDKKNFRIDPKVSQDDKGWNLEIKIPYSELEVPAPQPGSAWRGNFIWNRGKFSEKGLYAFSPTMGQSNHNTKFFGMLIFTDRDRFRDDFTEDTPSRWRASVRQGAVHDADAYARFEIKNGIGVLDARMSRSSHIAGIGTHPDVPVRRGDMLEITYRLPNKSSGDYMRLEASVNLTAPDRKPIFGWIADNRKFSDDGMKTFVVDIFEVAKADVDDARLASISIFLASGSGTQNVIEIERVRVSPHTILTVE